MKSIVDYYWYMRGEIMRNGTEGEACTSEHWCDPKPPATHYFQRDQRWVCSECAPQIDQHLCYDLGIGAWTLGAKKNLGCITAQERIMHLLTH